MIRSPDEQPQLDRADKRFIERLAIHYAPSTMTPAKRAAFDAALSKRLRNRARWQMLVPAVVAPAVAVLVAWLAISGWLPSVSKQENNREAVRVETPRTVPWEYELLFPSEPAESAAQDSDAALPDDYVAIAQVFLDR